MTMTPHTLILADFEEKASEDIGLKWNNGTTTGFFVTFSQK